MDKNQSFVQLEKYIREHMRMSHVYQPVMLRVLLENGGTAAVEDVAKALLNYGPIADRILRDPRQKHGWQGFDEKRHCRTCERRPANNRI